MNELDKDMEFPSPDPNTEDKLRVEDGSCATSCYAILSEETGPVRVYLDEARADKECSLLNQTEEWDETGAPSYYVEPVPFHA